MPSRRRSLRARCLCRFARPQSASEARVMRSLALTASDPLVCSRALYMCLRTRLRMRQRDRSHSRAHDLNSHFHLGARGASGHGLFACPVACKHLHPLPVLALSSAHRIHASCVCIEVRRRMEYSSGSGEDYMPPPPLPSPPPPQPPSNGCPGGAQVCGGQAGLLLFAMVLPFVLILACCAWLMWIKATGRGVPECCAGLPWCEDGEPQFGQGGGPQRGRPGMDHVEVQRELQAIRFGTSIHE